MPTPFPGGESQWLQSLLMILLLVFLAVAMLRQAAAERQPVEARKLVTVEDCGGRRVERDFTPGDYVGRILGDCDDGSPRRVIAIYSVKAEPGKRRQIRI